MKRVRLAALAALLIVLPVALAAEEETSETPEPMTVEELWQKLKAAQAMIEQLKEQLENLKGDVGGVKARHAKTAATVSKMGKTKLSGYIQVRFKAEEEDMREKESTFFVRRARLRAESKVTGASKFVLQLDAGENAVSVKDTYGEYAFPNSTIGLTLTAGQFKWPFGYEVVQSSSEREFPEQSSDRQARGSG